MRVRHLIKLAIGFFVILQKRRIYKNVITYLRKDEEFGRIAIGRFCSKYLRAICC